jgi:hypothetical protein
LVTIVAYGAQKITKEQVADAKGMLFHVDNGDAQALEQVLKKVEFQRRRKRSPLRVGGNEAGR